MTDNKGGDYGAGGNRDIPFHAKKIAAPTGRSQASATGTTVWAAVTTH
ncbi:MULTISPECIES: hypothetical protein [unclassified Sphingomonas]|nr:MULTISPECIES: hypothetical protein [unclassified Sphingomonas]